MAQWYYVLAGQRFGPISTDELQALLQTRQIQPTDHVWTDGMPEWSPFQAVPALAQSLASPVQNTTAAPAPVSPVDYATPVAASPDGITATRLAIEMLRKTRPWVRLISVVLLIGAALAVVAGIIMIGMRPANRATTADESVQPLLLIFIGAFYAVPAILLSNYAAALGKLIKTGTPANLESALRSQKSFWTFVGVLVLIGVIAYALLFLVMGARVLLK